MLNPLQKDPGSRTTGGGDAQFSWLCDPMLILHLPCGGPGNGPPRVHQHTPAVTSGRVALHWLVEAPMCTLGDHDVVILGLLGFLES